MIELGDVTLIDGSVVIAVAATLYTIIRIQLEIQRTVDRLEREVFGDEHDVRSGLLNELYDLGEQNQTLESYFDERFDELDTRISALEHTIDRRQREVNISLLRLAEQLDDSPPLPIEADTAYYESIWTARHVNDDDGDEPNGATDLDDDHGYDTNTD